jgi:hypothetical protein
MRKTHAGFAVLLVALCVPLSALADATVWTNGAGLGGATIRVTGANRVTTDRALTGPAPGGSGSVVSEDGTAFVSFAWGPEWRVYLSGLAGQRGASYGEGGVASFRPSSALDLFGAFEPPGSSGSAFRITGSGYAFGLGPDDESEIHYALLSVHPSVIPQGFRGTADDLVAQHIILPADVVTQFSASYPASESFDQQVLLGQVLDQDNVTLLAWIHGKCVSGCVPTVSAWGVAVMAMLVLTAGTIVVMRRRAAATT